MARRKPPTIPDELPDRLLAGRDPQAALGRDGLVDALKRALAEWALNAEMDHHLDSETAEAGRTAATATAARRCSPRGENCRSRAP